MPNIVIVNKKLEYSKIKLIKNLTEYLDFELINTTNKTIFIETEFDELGKVKKLTISN